MKRILCCLALVALPALYTFGQHHQPKEKDTESDPLSEMDEVLAQRIEEMLENTRNIVFIDSLVTDKDAFLSELRLSNDAGRFTNPDILFSSDEEQHVVGQCAFVNSLSSAVYYTQSDKSNEYSLYASFRNGGSWAVPLPLQGIGSFPYVDFPFVAADGVTLYFSAESEDGLGGLDLYVTRLNAETRQYVRPENLGFPFNSTANDYMLATDENAGIGVLVTDRRQPDDKVCIYWFILDDLLEGTPYSPPASVEDPDAVLRAYADISSIATTQKGKEQKVNKVLLQWKDALQTEQIAETEQHHFIICDKIIYKTLSQFKSSEARSSAARWAEGEILLRQMAAETDLLRHDYAITRSIKAQKRLQNLENALLSLRLSQQSLAKEFRQKELEKLGNM